MKGEAFLRFGVQGLEPGFQLERPGQVGGRHLRINRVRKAFAVGSQPVVAHSSDAGGAVNLPRLLLAQRVEPVARFDNPTVKRRVAFRPCKCLKERRSGVRGRGRGQAREEFGEKRRSRLRGAERKWDADGSLAEPFPERLALDGDPLPVNHHHQARPEVGRGVEACVQQRLELFKNGVNPASPLRICAFGPEAVFQFRPRGHWIRRPSTLAPHLYLEVREVPENAFELRVIEGGELFEERPEISLFGLKQ